MRKITTVAALRDYLDLMCNEMCRGDWRVCIVVPDGGVCGTSVVDVVTYSMGFDHDHGKMMLFPAEPLRRKPKRKEKP